MSRKRWPLWVVGFALAFLGVTSQLNRAIDEAEIRPAKIQSEVLSALPPLIQSMRQDSTDGVDAQVLILGDSMLVKGMRMRLEDTIPAVLQRELVRRTPLGNRIRVYPFAFLAAGYSTFYFVADRLIESGADQIVIGFNPGSLSASWRSQWARTDHVGWLGAGNIPEALGLPLHRLGITADRTLFRVACVELGCAETWTRVQRAQSSVSRLYSHYRNQWNDEQPSNPFAPAKSRLPGQLRPSQSRIVHGESFGRLRHDDVALKLIAATVRRFHRAEIPTLVYVTPINYQAMVALGVWDQTGFDDTVAKLASAVIESGGQFADFHDLLPEAGFRDGPGHLTYKGPHSGQQLLTERVATLILERLHDSQRATH